MIADVRLLGSYVDRWLGGVIHDPRFPNVDTLEAKAWYRRAESLAEQRLRSAQELQGIVVLAMLCAPVAFAVTAPGYAVLLFFVLSIPFTGLAYLYMWLVRAQVRRRVLAHFREVCRLPNLDEFTKLPGERGSAARDIADLFERGTRRTLRSYYHDISLGVSTSEDGAYTFAASTDSTNLVIPIQWIDYLAKWRRGRNRSMTRKYRKTLHAILLHELGHIMSQDSINSVALYWLERWVMRCSQLLIVGSLVFVSCSICLGFENASVLGFIVGFAAMSVGLALHQRVRQLQVANVGIEIEAEYLADFAVVAFGDSSVVDEYVAYLQNQTGIDELLREDAHAKRLEEVVRGRSLCGWFRQAYSWYTDILRVESSLLKPHVPALTRASYLKHVMVPRPNRDLQCSAARGHAGSDSSHCAAPVVDEGGIAANWQGRDVEKLETKQRALEPLADAARPRPCAKCEKCSCQSTLDDTTFTSAGLAVCRACAAVELISQGSRAQTLATQNQRRSAIMFVLLVATALAFGIHFIGLPIVAAVLTFALTEFIGAKWFNSGITTQLVTTVAASAMTAGLLLVNDDLSAEIIVTVAGIAFSASALLGRLSWLWSRFA